MGDWKTEAFRLSGFDVARARLNLDTLLCLGKPDVKIKDKGFVYSWKGMKGIEVDLNESQKGAEIRYDKDVASEEQLDALRESIVRGYERKTKLVLPVVKTKNWELEPAYFPVRG